MNRGKHVENTSQTTEGAAFGASDERQSDFDRPRPGNIDRAESTFSNDGFAEARARSLWYPSAYEK